jgi:MerR family redox-sensitive transcriptional activator SoxR
LLPAPARVHGQRRYGPDAVRRLALIQLAQRAGFSIAEIRALLHDAPAAAAPGQRWHLPAQRKRLEVDALLARVTAMRATLDMLLECTCADLEACSAAATAAARP